VSLRVEYGSQMPFHFCAGCVGSVGTSGDVQRGSDVMAKQTAGRSQLHHHRVFQRPPVRHPTVHCASNQTTVDVVAVHSAAVPPGATRCC